MLLELLLPGSGRSDALYIGTRLKCKQIKKEESGHGKERKLQFHKRHG